MIFQSYEQPTDAIRARGVADVQRGASCAAEFIGGCAARNGMAQIFENACYLPLRRVDQVGAADVVGARR